MQLHNKLHYIILYIILIQPKLDIVANSRGEEDVNTHSPTTRNNKTKMNTQKTNRPEVAVVLHFNSY